MAAITPKRLAYPLAVVIMIGGAVATYQTKHDAVEAAALVAELRHEIGQERIAISLLKAEWSELTQPARLQDLLGRYPDILDLGPYGVERMIRLGDIPYPPAAELDLIGAFLAGDG
jgi:hypothetical protein